MRCRERQERVLARDDFRGVLCFTVPEAIWLGLRPMPKPSSREKWRLSELDDTGVNATKTAGVEVEPLEVFIEVDVEPFTASRACLLLR